MNVVGIDSPGLSASPAIAKYVLNLIQPHVTLVEKDDYQEREAYVNLKVLNREQKNELIKKIPLMDAWLVVVNKLQKVKL